MSQCMSVNSKITWEEQNQSVLCVNLSKKKSLLYVSVPSSKQKKLLKNWTFYTNDSLKKVGMKLRR